MSRCGRTHLLEQLVAGELPGLDAELRGHAQHCARCRHELNWLESEHALFRQRASRDEVQHLWQGVARRSGLDVPARWNRVLVALAASLLVVLGVGRLSLGSHASSSTDAAVVTPAFDFEALASSESSPAEESLALEGTPVCSQLPTGLGFHCGPAIPASFLATR